MTFFYLIFYFCISFFIFISAASVKKFRNEYENHIEPTSSSMIFNIIGQNVEVNFADNNKISLSNNSLDNRNLSKDFVPIQQNNKKINKKLIYSRPLPNYIEEVMPPRLSHIFSKRISKRSLFYGNDNNLYLELSLFIDDSAYNYFMPDLFQDEEQLIELLLAYVNQIQAIFHHSVLENNIKIKIVKISFLNNQTFDMKEGHRDLLLDSFCKYQNELKINDPIHWDMAFLLTGLDLFVDENNNRNYDPLGLGVLNGICLPSSSCVIVEFGVNNNNNNNNGKKNWPSSGLMSSWAAAHEMAHNLGIFHDGPPYNPECSSNQFIMSPKRGTKGKTNWSICSAISLSKVNAQCLKDKFIENEYDLFNHNKFNMRPGQYWDANKQCKLFLRDNQSVVYAFKLETICDDSIICVTPNQLGQIIYIGPALDGTFCGENNWCVNGKCEKIST